MMDLQFNGVDWNSEDEQRILLKYGVPKHVVETALIGRQRVAEDLNQGAAEQRFASIGPDLKGRILVVVFTIRKKDGRRLASPISARYLSRRELKHYEAL
jgi:uncharacterized DUF497 family protein